ncbi:hypothetical protein FNV43_RR06220 [Rhamnella rubrinervis]|uniref:Uncharacterized protein n=1 Tax=Rhamnella rubrinervis TaxID=2594499 RepID=A0A8K0MLS2_9ROSA|nr:hypothetical protein FNV43_RR06220 [Rhamnella rubrinervis]
MASKSVFCVIALLVILSSQLAAEGNKRVSKYNMAMASKTLSDKGFIQYNFFDPAFKTLLYPRFDVKEDGILDTQVSKSSEVEEVPDQGYLLVGFVSIVFSLLVFTFYRCYEYCHDDDDAPIQDVEDIDV